MLQEPGAVPVVTVKLETPESWRDVICGNDCDFLSGLNSLDDTDIAF